MGSNKIVVVGLGANGGEHAGATRRAIVEYLQGMCRLGSVRWYSEPVGSHPDLNAVVPDEVLTTDLIKGRPWSNARALWRLPRDTVFICAFPAILLAWPFFLSIQDRRILFYIGNDIFALPSRWYNPSIFVSWIRRLLLALLCGLRSSVVAARGRLLAQRFSRINRNVFETIPITMPLDTLTKADLDLGEEKYILYVGKLIPEKGLDKLLAVYRGEDQAKLPNLVIAGSGAQEQEVRELSKLNSKIKFLGYLNDREKLASLYAGASALIMPTRAEWEGVPRVLTEANAFGLPIWATPLPTIRAEFGDSINYFSSKSPSALAIRAVLEKSPTSVERARPSDVSGAAEAAKQHFHRVSNS